jgi:hypothetical protein
MLALLVYLLPLATVMPRPGLGGAIDRIPGIVSARSRQAQMDVASDDRPAPRPFAPALPSACAPAGLEREPGGCSSAEGGGHDLAAVRPSPGSPRSPPVPQRLPAAR